MTSLSAKASCFSLAKLFFLSLSLLSNPLFAEPANSFHPHPSIIQTAQQFLSSNIDRSNFSKVEIVMGQLDNRLRLKHCTQPLQSTLAAGSRFAGKTTVHVKCTSDTPWTVYINAHVRLYEKVAVSSLPLPRGHILKKSDLELVETDLSQIKYGYFTELTPLLGQQLKRRLAQHRVIKVNYVTPPTLVKRGELVSIIAENSGYSVKMNGTALADGAQGDRIRVKNLSSKRIIEGVVKAAGVVDIN